MNAYVQSIEKATQYIEHHLKDSLQVEDVAKYINISYFHFHRIFFTLTGETLGDYIRKRRLTQAASELLTTHRRIIDIALDYQFESQEAFSRSFHAVYGVMPNKFRKKVIRPFITEKNTLIGQRLHHRLTQISIQPEIVCFTNPILVAGIKGKTSITNNRLPELWSLFREKQNQIRHAINPKVSYGICLVEQDYNLYDFTVDTEYFELAGLEVDSAADLPASMATHTIQPGYYAVFKHKGALAQIKSTYDYIWGSWISKSPCKLDLRDDFEVYDDDFLGPLNPLSVIRIYIPIHKPESL